ncbi:MAG: transposase, partial [Selenomonadaceae bacterium]|nr:transposase [Selenomonadaceae bacterium]
ARFAYNWALQKEREAYAAGEKFIGNNDLRKAFTVLRNSDQYSWLKTKRGDYSFYQDTDKIQITSTQVKLEAIATSKRRNGQRLNWIRLGERDRIPVGVKYFQPRITFDGLNWWLSVAVELELENISTPVGDALGIDLGIKNLAVCSDGTVYPNINKTKKIKKLKQRKRRLQRSISRKYEINKKKGEGY